MNASIIHRGPDSSRFGKYSFGGKTIFIGNNRLKIIDNSDNANQPFISIDGRYCLSFNGEIYNYKNLRNQLSNKYTFSSASDSEVLLYHLIENGIDGINALDGMFAFIFYDSKTETTIVARDRHGIKPVYYADNNHSLIVSSEIKGILASGLIKKEFNEVQIPHYLNYKYAKRPATFYKNISELEPGYLLEINDGIILLKKWVLPESNYTEYTDSINVVNDSRELLFKAVEAQLHSDVNNGIFLSGGIDSTLLLAISKEIGVNNIATYSVINSAEDRSYGTEDYVYAKKAAQLYNSNHTEISIDDELLKYAENLFSQLDQPIGDSAFLLTWLLSGTASKNIRVALSGAGADEWFAGYNRHWAYAKYLSSFYGHPFRIKTANNLSGILPEGIAYPFRKKARLWNKFASEISANPIETFDNFRSQRFPSNIITSGNKPIYSNEYNKANLFEQALTKDRNEYLVNDILMLTDKMSMLKSLEIRVPYLDNSLTQYLSKLPTEILLKNGPKWILKDILENLGGSEFTKRKKEGFGMPIGKWIKNSKNNFLLQHIKNKNSSIYSFISFEIVSQMLHDHLSNRKDYSSELWSLIVLTNWVQQEF